MTPVAYADVTLSNIVSSMGVFKPDKLDRLFQPYGDQGKSFFQELNRFGFVTPVAQTSYSQFEDERYHDVFALAGPVAAPAAGANLVANVSSDYVENLKVYPRVGDLVFKAAAPGIRGKVIAKEVSGSDVQLTIRPQKAAQTLGAVTDGDVWIIYSSSFGEDTGQPEPAINKVVEYTNFTQIVKETVATSGTVLTNKKWYDVREDGAALPSYWSEAMLAGEYRQHLKIDGAILWGDLTDNIADDQTTKGIITHALEAEGNLSTTTLNPAGFDQVDAYLRKVYAPNVIGGYMGQDKYREVENELTAFFADANINQVIRENNELPYGMRQSLGATVQYKYLVKSGRVFMFMNLRQLDNPTTYNQFAASDFNKYALFIPMTKTRDAKDNMSSYIGVRYKMLNGYDRMMEVWPDGAGHPGLKIGDVDTSKLYWRSDLGAHVLKVDQWAMVTG